MADVAAVGPRDGIVVVELSLDDESGWEIPTVAACLRAGAAAIELVPSARADAHTPRLVADVAKIARRVASEIEDEARRVHDEREAFYRRVEKEGRRKK